MTKKLRKAIAFILTLILCASLFSLPDINALAEVKDSSTEVSTVEQEKLQYPKAEVDHAVYAPPLDSKSEGTAKDPTLETKTESDGTTTTTETTWSGSSATADDRVTAVKGNNTTTETTATASDGSRTKTRTDKGTETLTTTTKKESAKTLVDATVIRGESSPFTTDTGWRDTWGPDDGEHLSGDKIDINLGAAYDAVTIALKPIDPAEKDESTSETLTQYTTREAMEAWIRANHPEVLTDPNAEVIVEPAYKTEWVQRGFTGFWDLVCDEEGNPIPLRDAKGNPLIESFYIRTSKTYEDAQTQDDSETNGGVTKETRNVSPNEGTSTVTSVAVELPDGYSPGETQETRNGLTVLTKVEVITDDVYGSDTYGQAVGYKVTETVTDRNGAKISSRSYSKYGTRAETETIVTPAADSKTGVKATTVTTTTKYMYYSRSNVERGAKADASRKVSFTVGKVTRGKDHNKIERDMLQPDAALLDKNLPDRHLISAEDAWTHEPSDPDTRTGAFRYDGYGLRSSASIWTKEPSQDKRFNTATQFKITAANGQVFYVYCCDKGTLAIASKDYDMVRLEDSGYITDPDSIAHIEAIASNGFWGTDGTDAGSLAAIRRLLDDAKESNAEDIPDSVRNLTSEQLNALDEGLALTATQAALWVYGHHTAGMTIGDPSGYPSVYTHQYDVQHNVWIAPEDQSEAELKQLDETEKAVVKALCDLLSSDYMVRQYQQKATEAPTETSKIIRAEDIKSAALTVKDRLKDSEDGKAVYNTDLMFTLAADTGVQTNDLVLQVMDVTKPEAPVVLAQKRIAGSGDTPEPVKGLVGTDEYENMTCTFQNLPLTNDTKLCLVLTGTQALQSGACLFQSVTGNYSDSQTFVGLISSPSKRTIDLKMDLSFHVEDAFMQNYETIQSEYREFTAGTKQTDISIDGAAQIVTRITAEDRIEKTWESNRQETFRTGHNPGDNNGNEVPGGDDDNTAVPGSGDNGSKARTLPAANGGKHASISEVPKTGDISLIRYLLMAFASLAFAGVTLRRKKYRVRKQES